MKLVETQTKLDDRELAALEAAFAIRAERHAVELANAATPRQHAALTRCDETRGSSGG